MFGRKKCPKCKEAVSKKSKFCPSCGLNLINSKKQTNNEWGMLGENDFIQDEIKLPFGLNGLFGGLLGQLSKQLEKEIKKDMTDMQKSISRENFSASPRGFSIKISSSGQNPPKIDIQEIGKIPQLKNQIQIEQPKKTKKYLPAFSLEKIKEFAKLQKQKPQTKVKRFSDKIIYEIDLPSVKSVKDIAIIKLENSIEIRAVSKNIAYHEIIQISLPIKNYNFSDEKLILELVNKE